MPTPKKKKVKDVRRPKGMRDIMGEQFYAFQGFFEKAAEAASYYGFLPIETPIAEKEGIYTSGIGVNTDIVGKEMFALKSKGGDSLVLRPEGTAGIMRAYIEGGMHTKPQPVMFYYHGPFFRYAKPQRGRWREFYQFGLETLGSEKSIADAITIQVTTIIIEEAGIKDFTVRINSIGDKVCRPQYVKDLVAYYRKHVNDLCPSCRTRIKTNPLRLLDCVNEHCAPLKEKAPEMVSYLCDPCKKHFKEVLEYLDVIKVPYAIDNTLVRGIDYYSRTVFEVVSEYEVVKENTSKKKKVVVKEDDAEAETENDETREEAKEEKVEKVMESTVLAGGGRYDDLAKKLGSKRETPSVGVSIGADRVLEHPDFQAHPPRILKKPKAYFIQIGSEAKLKSLEIIEILRKAKTPVLQALTKDKLSVQLALAEKMKIPYTIILGQKEALDNTVIVRDMNSRSQNTVKLEDLAEYLAKKK